MTYEQAMRDTAHIQEWRKAMQIEISQLEAINSWDEVDISDAKSKIIPGTWVFRDKRTPDGEIKKCKARFCCRGDLQEDTFETFAPVVSWTSVHLFLVLTTILHWSTCSLDFTNAFMQALLSSPIWVHLPRGYCSQCPGRTCLRLKKSQYGLTVAPRLWFQHLLTALQDLGFTQSKQDQCLLYKKDCLVIVYVDDVGVAAPNPDLIDKFVMDLKQQGFELTKEGSFSEYLGIKFEENPDDGTITLTQKGLIKKILQATGMENCSPNRHPLSTTEAKYSTLSMSLRTLIPLRDLLLEVTEALAIAAHHHATMTCRVFQDNHAAHQLATQQRITNRTKYFLVKWHWFWQHVCRNPNDVHDLAHFLTIQTCPTDEMRADYLTKGLLNEKFEKGHKQNQGW